MKGANREVDFSESKVTRHAWYFPPTCGNFSISDCRPVVCSTRKLEGWNLWILLAETEARQRSRLSFASIDSEHCQEVAAEWILQTRINWSPNPVFDFHLFSSSSLSFSLCLYMYILFRCKCDLQLRIKIYTCDFDGLNNKWNYLRQWTMFPMEGFKRDWQSEIWFESVTGWVLEKGKKSSDVLCKDKNCFFLFKENSLIYKAIDYFINLA